MFEPVKKGFDLVKAQEIKNLVNRISKFFYRNTVRKILPPLGYREFNGIKVFEKIKLGDRRLVGLRPYEQENIETYEEGLVKALQKHVKIGDDIVVVGGGYGVTAVKASMLTKESGSVICYEPSFKEYKKVRKAFTINGAPDNYQIFNCCVGSPISVYGEFNDSEIINPDKLPECDILQLDCEGAEKGILKEMCIEPRVIITETHGLYNSGSKVICNILKKKNYKILSSEVAEPSKAKFCLENDIKVVVAQKRECG